MPSTIQLSYHCIFQIEGAFIQGLGWVAMEELKWGDNNHKWIRPGHLFTCGPGAYKIPSVNDIPLNFKVSLLKVNILRICHWCFSLWGGFFLFPSEIIKPYIAEVDYKWQKC
jgi:hypothetical protein